MATCQVVPASVGAVGGVGGASLNDHSDEFDSGKELAITPSGPGRMTITEGAHHALRVCCAKSRLFWTHFPVAAVTAVATASPGTGLPQIPTQSKNSDNGF